MGVKHNPAIQEVNNAIAITNESDRVYSPAVDSASMSGIKNKIVVNDDVSKGIVNSLPTPLSASILEIPFSSLFMKSSATTIPLSTSKPKCERYQHDSRNDRTNNKPRPKTKKNNNREEDNY